MDKKVREHWSPVARWSLRLAIVSTLVLIYAVFLHRYEFITSPAAFALIAGGCSIAFVALALGIFAMLSTWVRVQRGLRHALSGSILSILILAYPVSLIGPGVLLPAIHDISTDLDNPPDFTAAHAGRPDWANSMEHPGGESALADAQRASYPQVTPLFLEMQTDEAFDLAMKVIQDLGWRVVGVEEPPRPGAPGQVEALAYTKLLAFANDVAIRVTEVPGGTLFDVRSISRYGKSDLGDNANRIIDIIQRIEDLENR